MPPDDATRLLHAVTRGDPGAVEQLLPLVYDELRALAARRLRAERPDHTLQPTALVHEAFLRLVHQEGQEWGGRAHFFAVAATAMRRILTDHARRRATAKRGGEWKRVDLAHANVGQSDELDVLVLDDLLNKLAALDARKARVVELRFFSGLAVEEIADVLGVSKTTVESEWRATRAWLSCQLNPA